MEQVKIGNLPLIGKIQHGEQQSEGKGTRVKELGYFITKIKNEYMKHFETKFNELYPQQRILKVRFFDENPLTIRNIRYNQGGTACYCKQGQESAKRKVQGKWEDVKCTEECEHKKFEKGKTKPACNREGILFFMLPEITTNRIWYMKITGQTSIDNIKDYILFQKMLGKSIIGDYNLVLNQITQTNQEGKTFKNYVLEIYEDEFNSQKSPVIERNKTIKSKDSEKIENKPGEVSKLEEKPKEKLPPKENKKSVVKAEDKKETIKPKETSKNTKQTTESENTNKINMNNYYALIGTSKKTVLKDNKPKEYVIGNFVDSDDKPIDVFIKDEFVAELMECDIGTLVELDLLTAGDKTFTNNIIYRNKCKKNVAA